VILLIRHTSDFESTFEFAGVYSNMVRACVAAEGYFDNETDRGAYYTLHRIEVDDPPDWRMASSARFFPGIKTPPTVLTIKRNKGDSRCTYIFPSGNTAQRHPRNNLKASA
jgi:hypothetical protein